MVWLLLAMFGAGQTAAWADVIYDQEGGTLKGLVVEEHRDRIVISTEQGEKTVLRNQIEEVFYSEPERNYLYLGNQALEEGDLSSAKGFFQKALQINLHLQEAEDALARTADLEKKMGFKDKQISSPLAALDEKWGLILQAGADLVTVAEVPLGSLAQRVGLAAGDGLVSSWSSSLAFMSPDQVAAELWGPPGSKLKLTIQRQIQLSGASAAPPGLWPGIKLGMEPMGLTVSNTESSVSVAALAGLRPGDRIVAINRQSTRYISLANARREIDKGKEKGLSLVIHRDLFLIRE